MRQKGDSKYKKLIEEFIELAERVVKAYSSKFSKKTYTQHQHIAAICLMKYENKTYRDTADLLKEIGHYFGFRKETPHFTTLQKFMKRIPSFVWDFIITKTYRLFNTKTADVAIDSTGFKERHTSSWYSWRIRDRSKKRKFMKHSIVVDTNRQAIIASKVCQSGMPDIVYFVPLVRKANDIVKINNLTADKGYDSEANHKFVRKEIGAFSIIPAKEWEEGYKTHGRYRRMMKDNFPTELYHRRNIVETVNSVQKRKFGDELRSRLWYMRKKELKVIDVVYNVHRLLRNSVYVVIGGFLLGGYNMCCPIIRRNSTIISSRRGFKTPVVHIDFGDQYV